MSLLELRDQLQVLVNAGRPLPIGAGAIEAAHLTPRPGLDELLRSRLMLTGDLEVTFTGELPPPSATTLEFSGTAAVLGASGVTAKIVFLAPDGGPTDVRAGIEPPDGWSLGAAFPILSGSPFSGLALTSTAYVVTTATGTQYDWHGQPRPLAPGAQLFTLVALEGPLQAVVDLLEGVTTGYRAELTGPIDPSDPDHTAGPVPAMSLTAPLDFTVGVPSFSLTSPRVELVSESDPSGERIAWIAFATTLTASGKPLFILSASVDPNGASLTFGLQPLPPPQPAITPDQIISLLGGEDYRTSVPKELHDLFDAVELRGLGTVIDTGGGNVELVSAAIGSHGAWGPWGPGDLAKVDDVVMEMTVVQPFSAARAVAVSFAATAEILPHVFQGPFVVQMDYDLGSKDLSVAASFPGTLSVNELIGGINPSLAIPQDWVSLSFSDFGLTFAKPGGAASTYTLFGQADAAFTLPFLGGHVDASLQAFVDSARQTYQLIGSIALQNAWFDGAATFGPDETEFVAGWSAPRPEDRLGIATVVSLIGLTPPQIPAGLDLDLQAARLKYHARARALAVEADSANYGKAVFVAAGGVGSTKYFTGIKVDRKLDLLELPLLGPALKGTTTLAIDSIEVLASSELTKDDVTALDQLIDPGYPQPPADGMRGFALTMALDVAGQQIPLTLVLGAQKQTAPELAGPTFDIVERRGGPGARSLVDTAGAAPPSPSAGTTWFNIQKSFGPVSFQKVGIRYRDSVLSVLMNASLSAGGLTISVFGLGMGSPLSSFEPEFTIDGLGVEMKRGPLELSGALIGTLRPLNFYGELLVAAKQFKLGALAGFAEIEGQPSLFGYLVVDVPIGGPPEFFVTGLAGGVGFNRQLVIPHADGVKDFPLVAWAIGSDDPPSSTPGGDVGDRVVAVAERLSQVVYPELGQYWIAAGIHFTTYKLLDCFALLTVKFGAEFEIALLGVASVQIPPSPAPAVARAELALEASFAPSTGLIAIGGQLTPASFIFSPDCHLTGGFAFWTWVSGEHAGDVVVTLGGYSPRFTPPKHYPAVPRLGLSWRLGPVSITGGLYFAVTSSAVMAGGSLEMIWESGPIRAWFTVEADFLIVFEPFHYFIKAGIQLGASFTVDLWLTTVRMTVHLGVDLEIWGPEFTGTATVDLSLISFTIDFGAGAKHADTTIAWSDFVSRLLPHTTPPPQPASRSLPAAAGAATEPAPAIVQIIVTGGLLKQLDGTGGIDFIADGQRIELVTRSAIPAKRWSTSSNLTVSGSHETDFGVGPTGTPATAFSPKHDVQIRTDQTGMQFLGTPDTANVAKAFWEKRDFDRNGVPVGVNPVEETTIPGVATGLHLVPVVPPPHYTLPIPLEELLYTEDETKIQDFSWSPAIGPTTDPFTDETVWGTITSPPAQSIRAALVSAIAAEGMTVPGTIDVSELATEAAFDLLEPPVLRLLGEQR